MTSSVLDQVVKIEVLYRSVWERLRQNKLIMLTEAKYLFIGFMILLEFLVFCFIVVSSLMVIYVMCFDKKLEKKTHYYILSTATADLLVAIVSIPAEIIMVSFIWFDKL